MVQKRKLQLGIRDLLMLTVLIAVFALGYRVGHEEHLKSLQKGFANFDELMQLIEETTVPETWESLGGPESMEPYPRNLSLVITSDIVVHEQENERGLAP